MINPHLGIIGLNPKKGKVSKMARKHGRRHMAWVRSHRRKTNPYIMAGPTAAALAGNPKRRHHRRRKSNPSPRRRRSLAVRGFFGLPPIMPVVYGSAGYVASAAIQGFIWGTSTTTGMIPANWKTNTDGSENKLTKYVVLAGSLIGTTWIAKMVFGPGPAALAGVGAGIYAIKTAVHDFIPDTVPGMEGPLNLARPLNLAAYSGLNAYTSVRPSSLNAPDWGAQNTTRSAEASQNIVAARFRRFQ